MGKLPLSTFMPLNTERAISNLVEYMRLLKNKERYEIRDCLLAIASESLKKMFCDAAIMQGWCSTGDTFVSEALGAQQLNRQNAGAKKGKASIKRTQSSLGLKSSDSDKAIKQTNKKTHLQSNASREVVKPVVEKNRMTTEERMGMAAKRLLDTIKATQYKKSDNKNNKGNRGKNNLTAEYATTGSKVFVNVRASALTVKSGVIKYKDYEYRRSDVTIPALDISDLKQIDHDVRLFMCEKSGKKRLEFYTRQEEETFISELNRVRNDKTFMLVRASDLVVDNGMICYKEYTYQKDGLSILSLEVSDLEDIEREVRVFLCNKGDERILKFQSPKEEEWLLGELNRIGESKDNKRSISAGTDGDRGNIISLHPSAFIVEKGRISVPLKSISFEARLIPNIPSRVLANMKKSYAIMIYKDRSTGCDRFRFAEPEGLSMFLEDATYAARSLGVDDTYVISKSDKLGIFELPWQNVRFCEGEVILTHPNASVLATLNPFRFRHPTIHKNYEDIRAYIVNNCPKFLVEGRDGRIVRVIRSVDFKKFIPHHVLPVIRYDDDIECYDVDRPRIGQSYTSDEFKKMSVIIKSKFIHFLSKMQLSEYKIRYVLENVRHSTSEFPIEEYGFLFTIKETYGYLTIVFENKSDQSRASLVFQVLKRDYDNALKAIIKFLSTEIVNRRQSIAMGTVHINNPSIVRVSRLTHSSYEEWCARMKKIKYSSFW